MTPAAEETLNKIRSRADRVLALLLVAHFPVALGLAAVHGDVAHRARLGRRDVRHHAAGWPTRSPARS